MSRFASADAVLATLRADLSAAAGADVAVALRRPGDLPLPVLDRLPGACIDDADVACDTWTVEPALLRAEPAVTTDECLHSHLLRSLCPVTGQPDLGSVLVSYRGPRIDPADLLRYIVSYRRHQDFHEACVERMFLDIRARCAPESLTVYARFQRRGAPAAEQGGGDAALGEHLQAQPVAHVERLEGFALRAEPEPPVGQHAIDVEHHEPDAPRALGRVRRDLRHRLTRPSRAAGRSCSARRPARPPR